MKREITSLMLLLAVTASATATTGNTATVRSASVETRQTPVQTITGRVQTRSGEPLAYANVVLLSMPDSTFVKGAVTVDDGTFSLEARCNGGIIRVSSVGYKDTTVGCTGSDAGTIIMEEDAQLLGEVEVTGHMPQYRQGAEGLQTNIEGTVLSKLNSAEDVLRNVPTVTKTNDGWEVFGKGSPIIYINGRKVQDLSELDNIKGSDIKSVEVIRNPGSRYDASVKAVIRIRTVKAQGEGFAIDAASAYAYNRYSNTTQLANLNWRHGGLNIFGTYRYRSWKHVVDNTNTITAQRDTLWESLARDHESFRNSYHYLQGGFSYDFNSNHSIGARYSANILGSARGSIIYSGIFNANGELFDNVTSYVRDLEKNKPTHRANVYYSGTVGKTQIDFNTDVYFSTDIDYMQNDEHSETSQSAVVDIRSSSNNSMLASKLVLTSPLLGGDFTYGAEYTDIHHRDLYNIVGTPLLGNTDNKLTELTAAPFLEYAHKTPVGQLSAGLRYEYVRFRYYNDGIWQPEQSRTYSNLYPNASLATQIGNVDLQLSYSVKTQRPSYSQLSSTYTYANRFTMQTGNPLLKNETVHGIELGGTWKFLQFSAGWQDRRNAIIYWMGQLEGNESVTLLSQANYPSLKTLTAYVSASPKIGLWSPQYSVSVQKQWFSTTDGNTRYTFNKPIFSFRLNNAFSLPWRLTANVNLSTQSRGNYENARFMRSQYVLDASLRKAFLKDEALTVEVKAENILNRQNKHIFLRTLNTSFLQDSDRRYSRNVTLTVRYKFNTTRSKYRGTGAGSDAVNRM